MFYVLTPAVTRKLNYEGGGLSYFQNVVPSLCSSSLIFSLLFTFVLHLARPFVPKKEPRPSKAS